MQQQRKPKIFWWHPRVMDYRLPLFDRALAAWQVHFFLLFDPGHDFSARTEVTVAKAAKAIGLRPWEIPWSEVKAMWRGVRDSDAVITSFLWNGYSLYLLIFAFLLRKPVTVWEERSKFAPTWLGRINILYYRVMRHFVASFYTLGEVQKNSMLGVGIEVDRVFVANEYPGLVYSEVSPKAFDLPGSRPEDRVLFLGRLITVKGVDVLLRAFALLLESKPDATLIIVGEGGELAPLKALSQELGISAQVAFLGAISDPAQKSYLFRECAVMAVPSVTNGGQSEGGPLVVLEALSVGLPVVSSNAIGSSERYVAAQDTRLVTPERSDLMLCNALKLVLADPEKFSATAKSVFDQVPTHAFQFEVLSRAIGLGSGKVR